MCHIFDKNYKLPKDLKLDLGGFDSAMKEIEINLDKIAQDIRQRKDNAMAMEFTRVIGELLKKNGVSVKITEYQTENHATNKFEMLCGCSIDGLDFSEHDKAFEDKITELEKRIQELDPIDAIRIDETWELKQRIAELESRETSELPFAPLETANYLINATYERETSSFERTFAKTPDKVNSDRYTVDDLEQIAEHLLVYCKHLRVKELNYR